VTLEPGPAFPPSNHHERGQPPSLNCNISILLTTSPISEDVDAHDGRGHASSLSSSSLSSPAPASTSPSSFTLRALAPPATGPPARCLRKLPPCGHRNGQQQRQFQHKSHSQPSPDSLGYQCSSTSILYRCHGWRLAFAPTFNFRYQQQQQQRPRWQALLPPVLKHQLPLATATSSTTTRPATSVPGYLKRQIQH
jgi:hypothetical protein